MANTFGTWLQRKYLEWAMNFIEPQKGLKSQADFARWLGIPTTSLSVWMSDTRKPSGSNVDVLADNLGLEVYDELGLPRKIPEDKYLKFICESWFRLSDDEKIMISDYVRKTLDGSK